MRVVITNMNEFLEAFADALRRRGGRVYQFELPPGETSQLRPYVIRVRAPFKINPNATVRQWDFTPLAFLAWKKFHGNQVYAPDWIKAARAAGVKMAIAREVEEATETPGANPVLAQEILNARRRGEVSKNEVHRLSYRNA